MKNQFILAFVTVVTLAFSSMAFAGEGCDSMKGAHKGMSAEEFKEFKKNHAWKNSPHNQIEGSSASTIEPPKTIEVKKSTPEIVEI